MFSSKTEPENTWVRVMGTSCADGSAGLMRPGGGLSTSSAGGRRPARGAQADRLGDGVAQAGRPERLTQRLVGPELHGDPQQEIGRASGRGRVGPDVENSVVPVI